MATTHRLMGDIYLTIDDGHLLFGNDLVELEFSCQTGQWLGIVDAKAGRCLVGTQPDHPAFTWRTGGHEIRPAGKRDRWRDSRLAILEEAEIWGQVTEYDGERCVSLAEEVELWVYARLGQWRLAQIFSLRPGKAIVRRQCELTNLGTDEVLLRDVLFQVPDIRVADEAATRVEAPGYPTPPAIPLTEVKDGLWAGTGVREGTSPGIPRLGLDAPGSYPGLLGLHDVAGTCALLVWGHSDTEPSIMALERHATGISVHQHLLVASRLQPGEAIRFGSQYIQIHRGPWLEALHGFQQWYREIGFVQWPYACSWARDAVLWEAHIGTVVFEPDRNYAPYPTLKDLLSDLPRISDLGYNTLQIMPRMPFPGYCVYDWHDLAVSYGGDEDLKGLVRVAHSMGMRVVLDILLHGALDREVARWDLDTYTIRNRFFRAWLEHAVERSPYREHPHWFLYDERGEIPRIYTWLFDAASRGLQDYVISSLRRYVEEFDVDGFRFDAPTYAFLPNWASDLSYRASLSYYASAVLLARARAELDPIKNDLLWYTEPSGPLFRRVMDLTYNYEYGWLWPALVDVVSPQGYAGSTAFDGRRITARQAAEWLEQRRLVQPAGTMTAHHLDSHDTWWWGERAQFRREAFGDAAARSLFALNAFLEGALMTFVGAEQESEDYYRHVLQVRRQHPALTKGTCDYLAVSSDDEMVLSFLRSTKGAHLIPVINLQPKATDCKLSWPAERLGIRPDAMYAVRDVFNNEWIGERVPQVGKELSEGLQVRLDPFQVRVLGFDHIG